MHQKEKQETKYLKIRKVYLEIAVLLTLCLMSVLYLKEDLFRLWQQKQGTVYVTYEDMASLLENSKECYLCGNSNRSLMGYYRKFDAIGLISLNDWYVLDFGLQEHDEQGKILNNKNAHSSSGLTNTGEVSIMTSSTPDRGMASMDISLPENYSVDIKVLQANLCQACLDKVTDSLEVSKWKYEKKQAIPLCVVDFQTLEVYSLQDWHLGYTIRDYWVEVDYKKNALEVNSFYLPKR